MRLIPARETTDEDTEDGLTDSLNHDLGLRKEEAPAV